MAEKTINLDAGDYVNVAIDHGRIELRVSLNGDKAFGYLDRATAIEIAHALNAAAVFAP